MGKVNSCSNSSTSLASAVFCTRLGTMQPRKRWLCSIRFRTNLSTARVDHRSVGLGTAGFGHHLAEHGALAEDDAFSAFQAASLAIFVTPERVMGFRLPDLLTSMVENSDRFHPKPILRSLTFPHHAYVLPIGIGAVRLVEISADLPPHVVPVPGLPTDAAPALGGRSHTERTGPMRSGTSTGENAITSTYRFPLAASQRKAEVGFRLVRDKF